MSINQIIQQQLSLAELRSSARTFQRLFWGKLPLKLVESAAIVDPQPTPAA